MKIILASGSVNRKRILKKAGLDFESFLPDIPEEEFLNPQEPENSCLKIAKQKALKAQSIYKKDIIISCDQMAFCEGEMFGKAHTEEKAIQNLKKLQGRTHELLTGLCMLWEDKEYSHLCKSQMSMRPLSLKQIQNYVREEQPLKCAGSYHVEEKGIALFEKIQSEDFNSIEGLPLMRTLNQLIKWNYPLLGFSGE